ATSYGLYRRHAKTRSQNVFHRRQRLPGVPAAEGTAARMANDEWERKGLDHPEVRKLFISQNFLSRDWYASRLKAKQTIEPKLWRRHVEYLPRFLRRARHGDEAGRLDVARRLEYARKTLAEVESSEHLQRLSGTLGAEPIEKYLATD